jgi:hypothetical protein
LTYTSTLLRVQIALRLPLPSPIELLLLILHALYELLVTLFRISLLRSSTLISLLPLLFAILLPPSIPLLARITVVRLLLLTLLRLPIGAIVLSVVTLRLITTISRVTNKLFILRSIPVRSVIITRRSGLLITRKGSGNGVITTSGRILRVLRRHIRLLLLLILIVPLRFGLDIVRGVDLLRGGFTVGLPIPLTILLLLYLLLGVLLLLLIVW